VNFKQRERGGREELEEALTEWEEVMGSWTAPLPDSMINGTISTRTYLSNVIST
jgi:hypothetical protein